MQFFAVIYAVLIPIFILRLIARTARRGDKMNRNEKLLWLASFVGLAIGLYLALIALHFSPPAPFSNTETSEYIEAAFVMVVTILVLHITKYDRQGRKGLLRFSKLSSQSTELFWTQVLGLGATAAFMIWCSFGIADLTFPYVSTISIQVEAGGFMLATLGEVIIAYALTYAAGEVDRLLHPRAVPEDAVK